MNLSGVSYPVKTLIFEGYTHIAVFYQQPLEDIRKLAVSTGQPYGLGTSDFSARLGTTTHIIVLKILHAEAVLELIPSKGKVAGAQDKGQKLKDCPFLDAECTIHEKVPGTERTTVERLHDFVLW